MDSQTLRQKVLKHCLWMATFDRNYALQAAAGYEHDCELLYGLMPRVKQTLDRQLNAKVSRSAPLLAQVGSTDGLERIFTTETEHDTD